MPVVTIIRIQFVGKLDNVSFYHASNKVIDVHMMVDILSGPSSSSCDFIKSKIFTTNDSVQPTNTFSLNISIKIRRKFSSFDFFVVG